MYRKNGTKKGGRQCKKGGVNEAAESKIDEPKMVVYWKLVGKRGSIN